MTSTPLPPPPAQPHPTSAEERQRWLDAAVDVARMAAARADGFFHRRASLEVQEKAPRDYVTLADKKTEELIVEELRGRFPEHAFVGEEGTAGTSGAVRIAPGQPVWVIDPIDGTANFIRGVPLWAVSVGLVVDGVPEVGVIACPRQDEVFVAARGLGATLYTRPIHASSRTELAGAQIAVGAPRRGTPVDMVRLSEQLAEGGSDVRRIGSCCVAMAWVACGRIDGYLENRLSPWDLAAGMCIVTEAGARHTDVTRPLPGDSDDGAATAWLRRPTPYCCAAPGVFDALTQLAGLGPG